MSFNQENIYEPVKLGGFEASEGAVVESIFVHLIEELGFELGA